MFGGRTWHDWMAQYSESHQHPVNIACHKIGIPLIAASIPLFGLALLVRSFWLVPLTMFIAGWIFQFIGHWFEGKPPEFLGDWRFLFVGLRWWAASLGKRVEPSSD